MNQEQNMMLNLNTEIWHRDSTNEWVIELSISYGDEYSINHRFSGETQLDALAMMNECINETLQEVIDTIRNGGIK